MLCWVLCSKEPRTVYVNVKHAKRLLTESCFRRCTIIFPLNCYNDLNFFRPIFTKYYSITSLIFFYFIFALFLFLLSAHSPSSDINSSVLISLKFKNFSQLCEYALCANHEFKLGVSLKQLH